MKNEILFQSKTCEWGTPQALFDHLNAIYQFTLDPCAKPDNAKCAVYFTKEQNGLSKPWSGRVFMNPPYNREIGKWIKKAHDELLSGNCAVVVCLIPARTDTRWWQEYCIPHDIEFIRGRLRHEGHTYGPSTFPSAIVVMKRRYR